MIPSQQPRETMGQLEPWWILRDIWDQRCLLANVFLNCRQLILCLSYHNLNYMAAV